MKNKSFLLFLAGVFAILIGMQRTWITDPAGIFNTQTRQLVENKNQIYQKTKVKPEIKLISVKSDEALSKIKAGKKTVIIAVAHTPKNNVQLVVGSELKKSISDAQSSNIIRYAGDKLRSSDNQAFNQGIRLVFNATTTLIDQKYNFPGDKNTLSQEQLHKIDHPQSVNFTWAVVVAIIATGAFTWYQGWKTKH